MTESRHCPICEWTLNNKSLVDSDVGHVSTLDDGRMVVTPRRHMVGWGNDQDEFYHLVQFAKKASTHVKKHFGDMQLNIHHMTNNGHIHMIIFKTKVEMQFESARCSATERR
jgi:hypothetical protein